MTTRERPILFSGPMVRAILDGSKSQTRRAIRHQPPAGYVDPHCENGWWMWRKWTPELCEHGVDTVRRHDSQCPYGIPGDRLWVRETWAKCGDTQRAIYRADVPRALGAYGCVRWTPSIHMPRWASRITLEVVDVRVERLQSISEEDAIAEGWKKQPERSTDPEVHWDAARDWYCDLWCSINGAQSWADNPFVWVVAFRRLT